jgi:hypothetical protein
MRRRFSLRTAILAALSMAVAAAAPPVGASTFVAMSTSDLVKSSSAVVEGEVLTLESRWTADRRIIVTDATVRVWDVLGGKAPEVVQVKTFGGTVRGFTVDAIGFPEFALGERVLLFLEPDTEVGRLRVNGYQQGLYRIVQGPDGIETAVPSVDHGVRLLSPSGAQAQPLPAIPLDDLRHLIRDEFERLNSAGAIQ